MHPVRSFRTRTVLTRLRDFQGRVLYAQGDYAAAAEAFERAPSPLAAAAAWDAARRPDKSVPIYAAAIRANPTDATLMERALAGVRFTGAHAALLAALADVETPVGLDGVPLLRARAEMLESSGAPKDALPLLRDLAERDESSADAVPPTSVRSFRGRKSTVGSSRTVVGSSSRNTGVSSRENFGVSERRSLLLFRSARTSHTT